MGVIQQYPTTYENIVIQSAPTTDELNQGQDITRYSRDPTIVKKEKRQSAFMQKVVVSFINFTPPLFFSILLVFDTVSTP